MSFLSRIKSYFKSFPLSMYVATPYGQSIITKDNAMDLYASWIFACVQRRANGLAAIDFKLYRMKKNQEVEEVLEHELLDLLYRVNPEMTKYDFMSLSVIYLDMMGASPWFLEGGKKGHTPNNLYILRPEYLKAVKDRDGRIIGYKYRIGQVEREFEKDEVIQLKNYNPKEPDKGLGVIEAARVAATHNDYIGQHNTNLLKNQARPGGFLTVENNLDPKEIKRLKKEFEDKYGGYSNSYKPMLLQGGLKFEAAMLTPQDLDFIQSRNMNRDEILSIFGVPKPIIGVFDDVNRASALTAEYIFAKWTLEPLATKYVEQLNEFLVPRYGDDLWLSFEPLAKDDDEQVTNRKEKAWNKWRTTNEIRAEEGLDPVTGGDIIYMPLSNMPYMRDEGQKHIELKSDGKSVAKVDSATQKYIRKRILNRNLKMRKMVEKTTDKIMANLKDKKEVILKVVPKKKELSDEQIETFYKQRMDEEPQLEKMWEKRFVDFFESQKQRWLDKMENTKSIKSIVDDYGISPYEELTATIEVISPLLYETFARGVQGASELIGEPAIMDMDFVKEWLDKVSAETGESINETTIKAFEDTMKEGIAEGESIGQLMNRVEDTFEWAKANRATLIARTETARAVTEAHRKMYEYYGFDKVKWLLSPGACELCIAMASEEWTVKTIEGVIPGKTHPNCKCDHTPL